MKKMIPFIAAFGLAFSVFGQTVTTTADTARDTTIRQDQSQYPDQDNRTGYAVRWYDFSVDGGAVGTIQLGEALPDNVAIVGGYAQVITAILPATSTNAIQIETAGDILAAGTTLNTTGLKKLVPQAQTGTFVSSVTPTTTELVYESDGSGTLATQTVVTAVASATATASTAVTPIQVDGTTETVDFVISGSAATQGVVMVVLDLLQLQ